MSFLSQPKQSDAFRPVFDRLLVFDRHLLVLIDSYIETDPNVPIILLQRYSFFTMMKFGLSGPQQC